MNKIISFSIATLILCFSYSAFPIAAEEQPIRKESFYSQLCRGVIRLEHYEQVIYEGSSKVQTKNIPDGTAFFISSQEGLFVVTARHVAEQKYDLHARVLTENKMTGEKEVALLKLPQNRWIYHPAREDEGTNCVDVAVMKIKEMKEYDVVTFGYEPHDPIKSQLSFVDPEPPESALLFGFPGDIGFDLKEQRPFGRLGIVSMVTGKQFIKVGNKFADEKACLIDVEAFPGNSGSPIISRDPKIKLLGLVSAASTTMHFAVIEPVSRIKEALEIAKDESIEGFECWVPLK